MSVRFAPVRGRLGTSSAAGSLGRALAVLLDRVLARVLWLRPERERGGRPLSAASRSAWVPKGDSSTEGWRVPLRTPTVAGWNRWGSRLRRMVA